MQTPKVEPIIVKSYLEGRKPQKTSFTIARAYRPCLGWCGVGAGGLGRGRFVTSQTLRTG